MSAIFRAKEIYVKKLSKNVRKQCKVDNCDRLERSSGLCTVHRNRKTFEADNNKYRTDGDRSKKKTCKVLGNSNDFIYQEDQVKELLLLTLTTKIPDHIQAIPSRSKYGEKMMGVNGNRY